MNYTERIYINAENETLVFTGHIIKVKLLKLAWICDVFVEIDPNSVNKEEWLFVFIWSIVLFYVKKKKKIDGNQQLEV